MKLIDKITMAIKDKGLDNFLCTTEIEKTCEQRDIGKFPEKYLGHRHCFGQIPYFKDMQLKNICHYKIEEYWEK